MATSATTYEYRENNPEISHGYLKPRIDDELVRNMSQPVPLSSTLGAEMVVSSPMYRDRGWHLYGTDFSETGIEITRRHYPEVTFIQADSQSVEAPAQLESLLGAVDLIISTEVIEHIYDPRGFLRTAHRYLKPNGMLILTTPYHGYLKNLLLAVTGSMDGHFTVLWDNGHLGYPKLQDASVS